MAKPSTYTTAQIIFLADLVRNLFANNAFLLLSRNWNAFARGKDVVWNQSGAKPGVIINRNVTALAPATRTDVKRTYELDEYQSNPTTIDWTDEMVINYAKRQDILSDHQLQTENTIAERILYRWSLGNSVVIRTSGDGKDAVSPGATGTRKKITAEDFFDARTALNKQNIPNDGRRVAIIPADMEGDLTKIKEFQSKDFYPNMVLVDGSLGKIAGFNVFVRSTTTIFNNDATPVAQNPQDDDTFTPRAGAATDNQSTLCYHPDFVTRSISPQSKVSIVPQHGADEFSTTMIAGGEKYRENGEGIVVIVEAVGA